MSSSPSHEATAACGSSGVCSCAGVEIETSIVTSAAASAASASPRESSLGSPMKCCSLTATARVDDVAEHLDVERERRDAAAAASSVSAATTAIGWPA